MRDDQPFISLTATQLKPEIRATLIERLREGDSLDVAVEHCGVDLQGVLDTIPYDPQLAIALMARDPYSRAEHEIAQRGIYLGQLALGVRAVDAARAAGVTASRIRKWGDKDPYFGRACQAVARYTQEFAAPMRRRTRLTPARTTRLFEMLESGQYNVSKASLELGLGESEVYGKKQRDPEFAARLEQAQARGQAAREAAASADT
ncbi:hypothetical protein [Streptomyces parvus]|uniref:hypothetical protein n=1 Tax=Streptomyces parvus TaxID=66428 RepID=UPI0035E1D546